MIYYLLASGSLIKLPKDLLIKFSINYLASILTVQEIIMNHFPIRKIDYNNFIGRTPLMMNSKEKYEKMSKFVGGMKITSKFIRPLQCVIFLVLLLACRKYLCTDK